jgi:DNA-directed RNA polymerase I, II, and III subunit RPABC5
MKIAIEINGVLKKCYFDNTFSFLNQQSLHIMSKKKRQSKKSKIEKDMKNDKVIYLTQEFVDKTPEGYVLDKIGFNKMCCRRHMLTHVDIE